MIGKGKNPFQVLGISTNASLETVKKAFTRLALRHHPDTAASRSTNGNHSLDSRNLGDSSISAAEQFVYIRQAYERIRDGSYQKSSSRRAGAEPASPFHRNVRNEQGGFSEQEFLEYFYQQTGLKLTSAQRRELLHLHHNRIPGGRYDGPSWDIARRVAAEQEVFLQRRSMHSGDPSVRTDSRDSIRSDDDSGINLRRKRRR